MAVLVLMKAKSKRRAVGGAAESHTARYGATSTPSTEITGSGSGINLMDKVTGWFDHSSRREGYQSVQEQDWTTGAADGVEMAKATR